MTLEQILWDTQNELHKCTTEAIQVPHNGPEVGYKLQAIEQRGKKWLQKSKEAIRAYIIEMTQHCGDDVDIFQYSRAEDRIHDLLKDLDLPYAKRNTVRNEEGKVDYIGQRLADIESMHDLSLRTHHGLKQFEMSKNSTWRQLELGDGQ